MQRSLQALRESNWPFKQPEVFEAIDGSLAPPPFGWKSGGGAWGCLRSHQRILEQALCDGLNSVLILEDDVCFVDGFAEKVRAFLEEVPGDWDQLMLGGQHVNVLGPPQLVKPGVYRCTDCERTHCYAVRGKYMQRLYQRWSRGGIFDGTVHCDWIMGRDPELQKAHKVYAPVEFLVGQEEDKSDISGAINPRKFWNPPSADLPVIHLEAPKEVAVALRHHGFHIGFTRDLDTELDVGLEKVARIGGAASPERTTALREWIEMIQWECASNPFYMCTVWHPDIALTETLQASRWQVLKIVATTIESALDQLPLQYRRKNKTPRAATEVILFCGSLQRVEKMRPRGWHRGYSLTPDGYDQGVDEAMQLKGANGEWMPYRKRVVALLQREAERIPNGVAVIWHPRMDADALRQVTRTTVIELNEHDMRDAATLP